MGLLLSTNHLHLPTKFTLHLLGKQWAIARVAQRTCTHNSHRVHLVVFQCLMKTAQHVQSTRKAIRYDGTVLKPSLADKYRMAQNMLPLPIVAWAFCDEHREHIGPAVDDCSALHFRRFSHGATNGTIHGPWPSFRASKCLFGKYAPTT